MTIQHQITINARPETVFAAYRKTADWPVWDSEVRAVDVPGGLVAGASGTLTPRQGPKSRVTVTEVVEGRGFVMTARLPLCVMAFGHDLTEEGAGTRVVHTLRFTGPLAFLFRRVIGHNIAKTLPSTLSGLKRYCEAG